MISSSKATNFADNDGDGDTSRRLKPFFHNEKLAQTGTFPPKILVADSAPRKTVFRQSQHVGGSKEHLSPAMSDEGERMRPADALETSAQLK